MRADQRTRRAAIRVGLLTLVSVGLLVVVLSWLQGMSLEQGQNFNVLFDDVDGMREGAPVQFLGIRAGSVLDVEPQKLDSGKYKVEVHFRLNDPDIKVPVGSTISIQQSGLIGEKFVEVTPPRLQEFLVQPGSRFQQRLAALADKPVILPPDKFPVKFEYQSGFLTVGQVERVETVLMETGAEKPGFRLWYRVTLPGAIKPEMPTYRLRLSPEQASVMYLGITSSDKELIKPAPSKDLVFTIEDPMRLKDFLEIQIASAESLKLTNDKMNQLLDEKTIQQLQATVANIRNLSGETSELIASANSLFKSMAQDLRAMVRATQTLTTQLSSLSQNLNQIIGDPQVQSDVKSSLHSLSEATDKLNTLMDDPILREALVTLNEAGAEIKTLSSDTRQFINDPKMRLHLENNLASLESILGRIDTILADLQSADPEVQSSKIQDIVDDTQVTADNLKRFSKKLKGHFILWKLMF